MAFTHKTQWLSGCFHILYISGSSAPSLLPIIMIQTGLSKDKSEEVTVLTPISIASESKTKQILAVKFT